MRSYDYIIVGAGSAGCVLANRLTADKDVSVLVLEAGDWDRSLFLKLPLASKRMWFEPRFNWNYMSEPEPHLDNRPIAVPRGKVVGGSSSINGMVYSRGHPADYDQWRQMGLQGWGYADVLPYFKRAETDSRGETTYHGGSGPLQVTPYKVNRKIYNAVTKAAENAGFNGTDDVHGATPEGFGIPDYSIGDGKRSSTARAFLRPVLSRPNLTVETEALASNIVFENGRAVGLAYRRRGQMQEVRAEREVILSGGAINSPQLLMLSGIGPADELREHGIEARADLPAVGKNLQDHLAVGIFFACSPEISFERELRLDRLALSMIQWGLTGKGIAAGLPLASMGFLRTRPGLERPDIQYLLAPVAPDAEVWFPGLRKPKGPHMTCRIIDLHPESRGKVTLRSANPDDPPVIFNNFLSSAADLITLRSGIKTARKIMATEPLTNYVGNEVDPSAACQTDDELDKFIRAQSSTIFHPIGTCRMGVDEGSVVDPELKVRGVDGLRVIDASVMPTVPGGNTNAPTIMIAEKASDILRGRSPLPAADI